MFKNGTWEVTIGNACALGFGWMDGWLAILRPFQQYIQSYQDDGMLMNERRCAVELHLRLRRFPCERKSNLVH